MSLIDDKGRLFGKLNVIDAFVLLLVLAVVGLGGTFALGGGSDTASDRTATVKIQMIEVQPYVVDAIPTGPVDSGGVVAVPNKSVGPAIVTVSTANGTLRQREHPRKRTVELTVELNVTATKEDLQFDGQPVEIGQRITLDLGPVTVEGVITAVETE
jgi:hypothetical protein